MNLLPGRRAARLAARVRLRPRARARLRERAARSRRGQGRALIASLGGFNLGVELGQLAIVAAALPPLLALRAAPRCGGAVMIASSVGCAALACGWLLERL